jgi:hypothetical protein
METKNTKLTKLPERWYVKWNRKIGAFFDKMAKSDCYSTYWDYLSSHNDYDTYILEANSNSSKCFSGKRGTEISIEDFERLVLNKPSKINYLWKLKIN